jgi:anaerobic glycerol-3-phosphate dehydrogenase
VRTSKKFYIFIVGGDLDGITAALELLDRQLKVVIIDYALLSKVTS